jgi:hypothetical protein
MKWGMGNLVSPGVALRRNPKRDVMLSVPLESSIHISWTARRRIRCSSSTCFLAPKSSCRVGFVRCYGGGRKALASVGCSPRNRRLNSRWAKNTSCTGHKSTVMQCRCPMNNRQRAQGVELLLCVAQGWCSCRHSFLNTPTFPASRVVGSLVACESFRRVAPSEAFARICHCFSFFFEFPYRE